MKERKKNRNPYIMTVGPGVTPETTSIRRSLLEIYNSNIFR